MNPIAIQWLSSRQEEASIWAHRAFSMSDWKADIKKPQSIANIILKDYGLDRKDEILKNVNSPTYWFKELENDLYEDISKLCNDPLFKKCAIGFIPDIRGNAISVCIEKNNSYAIGLNTGLIWLCMFIVEAIMLENSSNDDSGKQVFTLLKQIFTAKTNENFHQLFNKIQSYSKVEDKIEFGAIGTVLLKFIALHEFGHIKLGHTDKHKRDISISEKDGVESIYQSNNINSVHQDELLADQYAIQILINSASTKEVAWNSIMFIYAFFLTLDSIEEDTSEIICPEHPSPLVRARKIYNYAEKLLGTPKFDLFIWINVVFNTWKGNFMKELHFTIKTENKEDILFD